MKPVLLAVCALFCYASTNIMIDRKLSNLSPVTNSFVFCLIMTVMSIITMLVGLGKHSDFVAIKSQNLWPTLFVAGAIFFAAEIFYLGAYKAGGSVLTISTIVALFPVAVLIVEAVSGGNRVPSFRQCAAVCLAVASVFLVAKR